MTLIAIRERGRTDGGFDATVSFDGQGEYPVTVTNPFSKQDEELLEWYFEEHLALPFVGQVKAREAANSVTRCGETLFNQVFQDRDAFARYREALQGGVGELFFEIAGSPEFHQLHWESLKDPSLPKPFSVETPMVRKNLVPSPVRATVRPSPTINLLIVTARPGGERDVGYRTISRPLVERLRQANLRVQMEILRPGTYQALSRHLEQIRDQRGAGHYHVVHFDLHGALLTYEQLQKGVQANRFLYQARYGRTDIQPYDGLKSFLFFESAETDKADPAEANEVADLLITHQIPITALNACQSGKQIGATETSLGSRLMQAGAQMVLAMAYSVTVSAAELMMRTLYEQLFAGLELPAAIRRARLELYNRKGRRAYFNQTIDLEDWLLPVVYQNQPMQLKTREFTPDEQAAYYGRLAARYDAPEPTYKKFVGRDLDVLKIEQRILRHNQLLLRGMGGAGKTTLLHHLGAWWQTTQFVDRVFYFGYDARAWTRQQILNAIAEKLLTPVERATFQPLSLDAQQALLAERLRAKRHLLMLDNLESITGARLAIQNTLPPDERDALRRFLSDLSGGKTLVLLGSRGGEEWLAAGTFGDNVYELPGLDPEAASTLSDLILARHKATRYREDKEFQELLKLLDGYPLPMEVVLANLSRQTPAEVLAALRAGDVALDRGDAQKKTESILRCIEYSHSNLSPDAQALLTCLAPFTSVIFIGGLEAYTEQLRHQPALSRLPFDRWQEVLQEAASGLLRPDPNAPGFLRLQPIFPYFLRSRLNAPEQADLRHAVETAFRQYYDGLSREIYQLLISKEPDKKQIGQALAKLEYENFITALNLCLYAQVSILNPYNALASYLDATHDERRGLELGETVLARMETYPAEKLQGRLGVEFVRVIEDIAKRQLLLKQYQAAEESYQKALDLTAKLSGIDEKMRGTITALIYHRSGVVAQEQHQWAQAEQYYQNALQIYVEFNDRYAQADTYHQLGRIAEERRQWAQAEQYYQKALQIKIEFNDRYAQARTYHQLGRVAQEQRQWTQAEQYYQKALQIKTEFNDRHAQASTYHQLGIVAQAQHQWAQAEQYYQNALQICIEFNDRYAQADTYGQLGVLAQEQDQWAQAEQYYQNALQIYIDFNDRYAQAKTYHQLGIVAQEQGQWVQAEQYYQKALQIKIEFNDRYSQAGTYNNLGMVAQGQQQWAQAKEYYLRALETYVAYEDSYRRDLTLRNIARLWRDSGDASLPAAVAPILGIQPHEAEALLREGMGGEGE